MKGGAASATMPSPPTYKVAIETVALPTAAPGHDRQNST